MSTATKSAKSTKSTKSDKSDKSDKSTKLESTSEMEQDSHGIWNGRFKAKPQEAKLILEFFKALQFKFLDDESAAEILQYFWGESEESLQKIIKVSNQREKKKEAKFESKIAKPTSSLNLFGKVFKAQCDANNTKCTLQVRNTAWNSLTDKEKDKYKKQAEEQKKAYVIEYERLRLLAIEKGEFPEDKPKKPSTAFFLYLAEIRPILSEKYKNEPDRKAINQKITVETAEMWGKLTDAKKAKYNTAYIEAKQEYDVKIAEWSSKETSRMKKNDTSASVKSTDKIEIESTGKKSASKKPNLIEIEKEKEEEEAEAVDEAGEIDEELLVPDINKEEKSEKSEKSKKASKKTEKKKTVTSEDDSEEVEEVTKKSSKKTEKKSSKKATVVPDVDDISDDVPDSVIDEEPEHEVEVVPDVVPDVVEKQKSKPKAVKASKSSKK